MSERLRVDLVGAVRTLAATPALVGAAVITLAVAIGLNLAMFGLVDRALLRPPAHVADAARVFTLAFQPPGERGAARMTSTSYVAFARIRDQVPALDAAAFQRVATAAVIAGDQRPVNAMLISGNYFTLLGARPLLGRGITVEDDLSGVAAPGVVLSHAFWSSAFSRDRAVLGRPISVRGLDYVVSGVMPEEFSGHTSTAVDLWLPFAAAMRQTPGWDGDPYRNLASIVVRLMPGEGAAAATARAGALVDRHVTLVSIAGADVTGPEQRVAWWLCGIALLVLVMGLANAAILLVVRTARTRLDLSIRAALGAPRSRLISHALWEAAVLSLAATSLALALESWLDNAVRTVLFPGIIGRAGLHGVNLWPAMLTGVVAFAVAGVVNVRLLPSLLQPVPAASLARAGARRARPMTGLLLIQTAFSVLLLAGAGLFSASLFKLGAQDFGMTMDEVLLVDFEQGPGRIADQDAIFLRALDQVRAMPGVQAATAIDAIPFSGFHVPPISVPGRAEPPAIGEQLPFLTAVTPEFLQILGIRVVEGRSLTAADDRGGPVVMVNQTMARGVWPGESALGKCIRIGFDPGFDPAAFDPSSGPPMPTSVPCRQVVGVFRDLRQRSVVPAGNEARLMQYFVPLSQVPRPPFANEGTTVRGLMIRAGIDPGALAPVVRRAVVGDRTDLPFVRVRPYTQLLERQMRPWSMGASLLGLFSLLALVVAAVGLYAAFAHAVGERRREMAIRLAVGARPAGVLRMVMGEAVVIAAVGAAAGVALAIGAGRWLQALLYDTQAADPLVLGVAAAAMLLVAAVAVWRPARSAALSDPSALLKTQ